MVEAPGVEPAGERPNRLRRAPPSAPLVAHVQLLAPVVVPQGQLKVNLLSGIANIEEAVGAVELGVS